MNCDRLLRNVPPDTNFDPVQLRIGTKVEMEHTRSPRIAKQIAKTHLSESPLYYKALRKMERRLNKK